MASGHGGARPGAGRKKEFEDPFKVQLPYDTQANLDRYASGRGIGRSDAIRDILADFFTNRQETTMTDTDDPGFEFRTYRRWNVDRAEFIDLQPGDAVPENVRVRAYYTPDEGDDLGLLPPRLDTDAAPWSAQWWAEYIELLEGLGYKEV